MGIEGYFDYFFPLLRNGFLQMLAIWLSTLYNYIILLI